jgi:uncharacterized protein YceK
MMRKIVIATIVTLMLAGCSSENTGASSGEGDATQVRMNGHDGKEALNVSIGADLAVDMPKGYSVYPGAMVFTKSNVDQGDSTALVVILASKDSPEKLSAFYRNQAETAGVKFNRESVSAGTHVLMGEDPDGMVFVLAASPDGSGTTAQLTVGVPKDN